MQRIEQHAQRHHRHDEAHEARRTIEGDVGRLKADVRQNIALDVPGESHTQASPSSASAPPIAITMHMRAASLASLVSAHAG